MKPITSLPNILHWKLLNWKKFVWAESLDLLLNSPSSGMKKCGLFLEGMCQMSWNQWSYSRAEFGSLRVGLSKKNGRNHKTAWGRHLMWVIWTVITDRGMRRSNGGKTRYILIETGQHGRHVVCKCCQTRMLQLLFREKGFPTYPRPSAHGSSIYSRGI